ncbi:kinase-like domain-containing protein [Xylaria arbuscula]|nr:kinase-like domain-containing protein [Xylaria arbuscula]
MTLLSQKEKYDLVHNVLQALSETPYACSSLTHLTNGTTNFVFRGKLVRPIRGEESESSVIASTVIVKHSLPHAALNKDLPIDASRTLYEESMLDALSDFHPGVVGVKAPRLYLFIREKNIQVLEDFPATEDLKSVFVSPDRDKILTRQEATSLGHDIGVWLRSFHDWSMSPNARLKGFRDNEPMRKLKYAITYDSYLRVLENSFPDILEGHRSILQQVKEVATKEFERSSTVEDADKDWGLIHGDFWTGNVLVPNDLSSLASQSPDESKLFIIDWEFTQYGHRSYDIGQMIGDIYERWHFWKAEGAIPAINGFIRGYGQLEDNDLAFRIAIHAGVQLIGWYTRRAPNAPLRFPPAQVRDAMRIGRDWIEKGWQKDIRYFEDTPLASLFSSEKGFDMP